MFETRVETSQDSLQKISDFLEKVYKDPINVSKKLRKISHWELEISSYLFNISKEVSQLTDWHTYKKFEKIEMSVGKS